MILIPANLIDGRSDADCPSLSRRLPAKRGRRLGALTYIICGTVALMAPSAFGNAQSASGSSELSATKSFARNLETNDAECPLTQSEISARTGYVFEADTTSGAVSCSYTAGSYSSPDVINFFMSYKTGMSFDAAKAILTDTPSLSDGSCKEMPVDGPGSYGMRCEPTPTAYGTGTGSAELLFGVGDDAHFRISVSGSFGSRRSDVTSAQCASIALALYEALKY